VRSRAVGDGDDLSGGAGVIECLHNPPRRDGCDLQASRRPVKGKGVQAHDLLRVADDVMFRLRSVDLQSAKSQLQIAVESGVWKNREGHHDSPARSIERRSTATPMSSDGVGWEVGSVTTVNLTFFRVGAIRRRPSWISQFLQSVMSASSTFA